jgi:serine/threonine protein kinase
MSAEVIEKWLKTGHSAIINQRFIKPIEHNLLKGKPLSSQKGQAEAFFLIDDKSGWWLLKKFYSTCKLDRAYLGKVGSLLPKNPGFVCATERQILTKSSLVRGKGYYYSKQLEQWLDETILMPKVNGIDWSTLADEIRDGSINLKQQQRIAICKNLVRLIELLENSHCCHRDLSCGNIFINTDTWDVYLIDFDSFYHRSLPIQLRCCQGGYLG